MANSLINRFLESYIETALWLSTDDNDEPLDKGDHELSDECKAKFAADCKKFEAESDELFAQHDLDPSNFHVAHDFWLTRNGHGAGFGDGDYPEPIATLLTKLAESYGECDLYIGDDGKIYC